MMTIERTMLVGRAKKPSSERLVAISVRVKPETAQAIAAMGRHRGEWIRKTIEDALRKSVGE